MPCLQLYNEGKIDELMRAWIEDISECPDIGDAAANKLQLQQFSGLFFLLLIFLAVAIVWATGEHLVLCLARRNPGVAKAMMSPLNRVSGMVKRHSSRNLARSGSLDSGHGNGGSGMALPQHVKDHEMALHSNPLAV